MPKVGDVYTYIDNSYQYEIVAINPIYLTYLCTNIQCNNVDRYTITLKQWNSWFQTYKEHLFFGLLKKEWTEIGF